MNIFFKTLIGLVSMMLFVGSFVVLIGWGIDRQEAYECEKWLSESKLYSDIWFASDWQYKQCEAHNIALPVK